MKFVPWTDVDPAAALQLSSQGFNESGSSGPTLDQQLASIDLKSSFAAVADGDIVAVTQCSIFTQMDRGRARKVLANTGTAVRADYRGQGVGQQLLRILGASLAETDIEGIYAWGKNPGLTGNAWEQGNELTLRQLRLDETERSSPYSVDANVPVRDFCNIQQQLAAAVPGGLFLDATFYASLCCGPGSEITNFVVRCDGSVIACGWGISSITAGSITVSDIFVAPGHTVRSVLPAVHRSGSYVTMRILDSGNWGHLDDHETERVFVAYLYSHFARDESGIRGVDLRAPFYF